MKLDRRYLLPGALLGLIVAALLLQLDWRDVVEPAAHKDGEGHESGGRVKVYWFIPDGLRAEPDLFRIFEWARAGDMPNLLRMMQGGTYGYSVPVFPGHTPTNFATLLTGTEPAVHGVADGPMRLAKYPLSIVSKSGFSSHAKRVPPIWFTLESAGYNMALLSVPGSTPPELSRGLTIKGRWGGWGIDFAATNFHSASDTDTRRRQGLENRLFEQGMSLTTYLSTADPSTWRQLPESHSEVREVTFTNWGARVYGLIYDTTNDGLENYDRVLLSLDKNSTWADLGVGDWSDWLSISLKWQTGNDYNLFTPKKSDIELGLTGIDVDTKVRVKVIRLGERDFFRIRFLYDGLNQFVTKPPHIADELHKAAGPMVDFADNYPPQLIYYPEDKQTFFEEAMMSLDWHRKAARYLIKGTESEVVIHDIYTPNQFLTSRWWMKYLDPDSRRYDEIGEDEREDLWRETKEMYQGIDRILGEILDSVDEDAYVVLSSDHGAVPLDTRVRLNNLFAREGLLKFRTDAETGYTTIDWDNTKAVFLKMDNVYINPDGLSGNYTRASGAAYRALRDDVIRLLQDLDDGAGNRPLHHLVTWERAGELGLPTDRVGDMVIANRAGFGWSEEITTDLEIFTESLSSGYKQAVDPTSRNGMWTPFVVFGPGVRKDHQLQKPVRHIDQYPTVMKLLGEESPRFVQGKVIDEMF